MARPRQILDRRRRMRAWLFEGPEMTAGFIIDDGRPAIAARSNALARIELQTTLRFSRSRRVTLVAVFDQDRPNLGFKEGKPFGVLGAGRRLTGRCPDSCQSYDQKRAGDSNRIE